MGQDENLQTKNFLAKQGGDLARRFDLQPISAKKGEGGLSRGGT